MMEIYPPLPDDPTLLTKLVWYAEESGMLREQVRQLRQDNEQLQIAVFNLTNQLKKGVKDGK